MSVVLETARDADLPAIGALNVASYADFEPLLSADAWRQMEENLSHPERVAARAAFIVLRSGSEIAGSVAYCPSGRSVDPLPAEWASVLLLAVAPGHRGKGYGEILAGECVKRASADSASVIGLFTSEAMVAAQRIYARLGFLRESEIPPRYGMRYFRYRLDL